MSITGQCPACGKPYAFDDKYAGRRKTCKECGEVMRLPTTEDAPKLRVECDHCGQGHWISPEHAGKKTICKSCGTLFRIQVARDRTGAD